MFYDPNRVIVLKVTCSTNSPKRLKIKTQQTIHSTLSSNFIWMNSKKYLFFTYEPWSLNSKGEVICTNGEKLEFWENFWAFQFQHFDFNVCTKYSLFEYLSSILSIVAFLQKLCDFVDLFSMIGKLFKPSFISTMGFMNEELCLLQELIKKTRPMLKPPVL